MLRDDINNALKDAMKAQRQAPRLDAAAWSTAALKNADIEARGQGKPPLGDDEIARRCCRR